jgi:hypothetical protein
MIDRLEASQALAERRWPLNTMSHALLIVNADDFGYSRNVTDPVVAAYDEGLITSTTAMVWMRDTSRAVTFARERGMPVGLHLNLTLPFDGDHVPERVREQQARLTGMFDARSWSQVDLRHRAPDPQIREAVRHQLGSFRAQFGEPTHIDGHHHIHLHPAVLVCLPTDLPIRPPLTPPARVEAKPDRRGRFVRKTFGGPDRCVSLQQIHPSLGGTGLELLAVAHKRVLEVMVHAQIDEEREALESDEWRAALASLELGSYREFQRR